MNGKMKICFVSVLTIMCFASANLAASQVTPGLLRDGYVIRSVQARVIADTGKGVFFLEFAEDVNDTVSLVKSGTKVQLLPSSMLQKLRDNLASRDQNTYLITGRVTQYKNQNYLYPTYFRSVMVVEPEPQKQVSEEPEKKPEEKPAEPEKTTKPQEQPAQDKVQPEQKEETSEPLVQDANNPLGIPQEVLDRINSNKVVRTRIEEKPVEKIEPVKPEPEPVKDEKKVQTVEKKQTAAEPAAIVDSALADRMAYLKKLENGTLVFVLDGYGLSAKGASLRLLPCQALELAEDMCKSSPEKLRFKIAGIKTSYLGMDYLLLQRAIPTYSHGNFRAFIPQ